MKAVFSLLIAVIASQVPTLRDMEERLVRSGYSETLDNAYWAVDQGEKIVPTLERLLKNKQRYRNELGGATGAFPFNVYWALAHIPSEKALLVLERQSDPEERMVRQLAIKGFELRRKMKGQKYGVTGEGQKLLAGSSERSKLLANLPTGTAVKILREMIRNEKEMGARGGPATFDYIQVIATKAKGYIQRAGDDFSPFF